MRNDTIYSIYFFISIYLQGAFDLKVDAHKKHKGLKSENLRDHMTDLEFIITMLGEAPGFTPVIINIQPLQSLPKFLGLTQDNPIASSTIG